MGSDVPLTGRISRWAFALLLLAVSTVLNLWIHRVTGGRTPFQPFFPAIIAIGFASGTAPGLLALAYAECFVGFAWLLPPKPALSGTSNLRLRRWCSLRWARAWHWALRPLRAT